MTQTKENHYLVCLPYFSGFYESDLSGAIDREEEMDAENYAEREIPYPRSEPKTLTLTGEPEEEHDWKPEHLRIDKDEYAEIFFNHTDYQKVYLRVAQFWVDAFDCWCREFLGTPEKSFAFESMHSPREYNFTTDRVFAWVPVKVIEDLFARSAKEEHKTLDECIRESFTSRSGFFSFYSNDLETWLAKPLAEWDYNEMMTLVRAAIMSCEEFEDRSHFCWALYEYCFSGNNEEGEALDSGRDWSKIEQAIADLRVKKLEEHNAQEAAQ